MPYCTEYSAVRFIVRIQYAVELGSVGGALDFIGMYTIYEYKVAV